MSVSHMRYTDLLIQIVYMIIADVFLLVFIPIRIITPNCPFFVNLGLICLENILA